MTQQSYPKISVIMPVYNANLTWLREAIDSILFQTYPHFELIIINDGSTNNLEEVIAAYKDNRIKYYTQKNQGIAKTLNRGLSLATGEYIARMDCDDISSPDRFEKQILFLQTHPDISVVGTWFEMFPNTQVIKHPIAPCYLDMLKCCYIGHPTVMLRRSDFEKYNLKYDPTYKCEDYELWSRAIRMLKFANIPEVLLKYRWHGGNLSQSSEAFNASVQQVQQNMLYFLTGDSQLQTQLMQLLFPPEPPKKEHFIEKILSIKNSSDRQYKVFTLLGLKLKIKRKSK